MKVNTINEGYQPRAQNICEYQISKQVSNIPKNKEEIYPQDRIETSSTVKQTIQSVSNKQVELNYSLHDKKVSAEVINENGERVKVKGENLPKELKQINSLTIFKAFLNSAYAKVSTLSDSNYKLDINQKLLGGMWQEGKEVDEESKINIVTPQTASSSQEEEIQQYLHVLNTQLGELQEQNVVLSHEHVLTFLEKENTEAYNTIYSLVENNGYIEAFKEYPMLINIFKNKVDKVRSELILSKVSESFEYLQELRQQSPSQQLPGLTRKEIEETIKNLQELQKYLV